MKHDKLTQLGRIPTYTQTVASRLNWLRRNLIGLRQQLAFTDSYYIRSRPEWLDMSAPRQFTIARIEYAAQDARAAVDAVIHEIEHFQSLPITKEDAARGRLPKRRKQKKDATLEN